MKNREDSGNTKLKVIDFYLRHVNPEPSPSNESLVDGKVQRLGNEELEPISPK